MRTINISRLLLLLFAATALFNTVQAQDKEKAVKDMLDSRQYIFVAQSVNPLGARFQQLTSEYDVRVLGDSVISFLPYFGRAYSPPADPSRAGIQFTSTNFEYRQQARRRGGWNITILPKDAGDVRQMHLTVSESGNATLQVVSNNRQPISFNGYIMRK